MRDLVDHAANGRCIFQLTGLVHLVEAEAYQRCALVGWAADRAADLFDDDGFSQFSVLKLRRRQVQLLAHHHGGRCQQLSCHGAMRPYEG